MGTIRILPVHLVNKIAAGEVIERPASVVKELIENALDAGSTRIDVTVEDGGRKLIAVADNGRGMTADDLALVFAPHATSKLPAEDTLFDIRTMGFRGEALASVASISHAHIRSAQPGAGSGHEISASGETIDEVRPCASSVGTTVTVRDLFFNTPARRKFLRTANTEMGHISEQISRLALPHPRVAFTLTHNGRASLKLPAADTTAARIRDLFGADISEGLLPIAASREGIDVAGLTGSPSAVRGSGKWQYIFVNGRYIRDRLLGHALREAYRGLVDPARYPAAFIFLTVPPDRIDVNVHPTKIEVRFAEGQLVHSLLLGALKEALNQAALSPTIQLTDAEKAQALGPEPPDTERQQSLKEALADFLKSAKPQTATTTEQPSPRGRETFAPAIAPDSFPPAAAGGLSDERAPLPVPESPFQPAGNVPPSAIRPPGLGAEAIQVNNTYLVAPTDDGLIIVDQHALHERIIYNQITDRLTDSPLTGQRMLIPQTLSVTAAEADLLARSEDLLSRLGIVVESFGPTTLAIQQFPTLLLERNVQPHVFVRDALDTLADDASAGAEHLMESLLQLIACKAAVKAGDRLSSEEIDDLLARRHEALKGSSCPHGRPTTLTLTVADLAKQFKRT